MQQIWLHLSCEQLQRLALDEQTARWILKIGIDHSEDAALYFRPRDSVWNEAFYRRAAIAGSHWIYRLSLQRCVLVSSQISDPLSQLQAIPAHFA